MLKKLALLVAVIVLCACTAQPQLPVAVDSSALLQSDKTMGVYLDTVPEPRLSLPGADCLLCIAVASAANSSTSNHVKTFETEDISNLKADVLTLLGSNGREAFDIDTPIELSDLPKHSSEDPIATRSDYSGLGLELGVDRLFVLDIDAVGAVRNYASYVPTSPPLAWVTGRSYIVDVTTNTYLWYEPIDIRLGAEGEWDEPPEYPGLTNSYYQVLEMLRDRVLSPLSTGGMENDSQSAKPVP